MHARCRPMNGRAFKGVPRVMGRYGRRSWRRIGLTTDLAVGELAVRMGSSLNQLGKLPSPVRGGSAVPRRPTRVRGDGTAEERAASGLARTVLCLPDRR